MKKNVLLLLVFLFAGSVGIAFAGDPVSPENAPLKEWIDTSNKANTLLCATVGDIGGTGLFGCKGKETGIHSILKTFNVAVFSIAALFVFWNVIAGVMASANDGEFLGKKNHSTWGPLRMVVGGAMLVPAFGGFNLAQLLMIWATAVGVGIAGAGASSAITEMNAFNKIYAAPSNLITADQVADMIKPKTACVAYWNATVNQWKKEEVADASAVSQVWGFLAIEGVNAKGENALNLNYGGLGDSAEGGYRGDDCGVVSFILPRALSTQDSGEAAILQAAAGAMVSGIPVLAAAFVEAGNKLAMGQVTDEASAIALEQMIIAAKRDFDSTMKSATALAAEGANYLESKTSVGKGDWVSLGFATVKIAKAGANVARKVAPQPEATAARVPPPGGGGSDSDMANAIGGYVEPPKGESSLLKLVVGVATDGLAKTFEGFVDDFNKGMKVRVGELGNSVAAIISSIGDDGPMKGLISLGLKTSAWGATVLTGFIVGATVIVAAMIILPGAGAAGGLITVMGFVVTALVMPLMFFGVKLAAYLPFLSAVIWSGAILNWLVIVIEALFGAPLWAMVHLDLEGEGMNMQRTGHGYIFLLNLLFRPIMMVGALVFATLAMNAVFGLFLGAITGSITGMADDSSDWWANLMLIIGAIWVTVAFAEQIITQSLGLIFQIPDKVFAWIGGHFGSNVGADMERGVGSQVGQMAGGTGSAGREGAQAVAKGAGDMGARYSKEARSERAHNKQRMVNEKKAWAAGEGGGNKLRPGGNKSGG